MKHLKDIFLINQCIVLLIYILIRSEMATKAFNPRPRLPINGFSCSNSYSLFWCQDMKSACCCDIGTSYLHCVPDFSRCDFNGGTGDVCM